MRKSEIHAGVSGGICMGPRLWVCLLWNPEIELGTGELLQDAHRAGAEEEQLPWPRRSPGRDRRSEQGTAAGKTRRLPLAKRPKWRRWTRPPDSACGRKRRSVACPRAVPNFQSDASCQIHTGCWNGRVDSLSKRDVSLGAGSHGPRSSDRILRQTRKSEET